MAYTETIADQNVIEFFGVNDIVDCIDGSVSGCVWAGLGFIPIGGLATKAGGWLLEAGARFLGKIFGKGDEAVDAASTAAKACNSFTPGTLVLMADGTTKPIEDIKVGDQVIATDPMTGETGPREVTATPQTHAIRDLVDITIDTDGDGQGDGTVTATAGHEFWTATSPDGDNQRWMTARDLTTNTWLHTNTDGWIKVSTLDEYHQVTTTHNLTVDVVHTYHVGKPTLLVHNCMWSGEALGELSTNYGLEADKLATVKAMSNDELIESFNNPRDGEFVLVQDGRIWNGHHRVYELLFRIRNGTIPADVQVRIDPYVSELPSDGFWY